MRKVLMPPIALLAARAQRYRGGRTTPWSGGRNIEPKLYGYVRACVRTCMHMCISIIIVTTTAVSILIITTTSIIIIVVVVGVVIIVVVIIDDIIRIHFGSLSCNRPLIAQRSTASRREANDTTAAGPPRRRTSQRVGVRRAHGGVHQDVAEGVPRHMERPPCRVAVHRRERGQHRRPGLRAGDLEMEVHLRCRSGASRRGTSRSGASRSGASGGSRSGASRSGASRRGASRSGASRRGASCSGARRRGASRSGASKSGASRSGASRNGRSDGDGLSGASRSGASRRLAAFLHQEASSLAAVSGAAHQHPDSVHASSYDSDYDADAEAAAFLWHM